jgi:hypothetical protein
MRPKEVQSICPFIEAEPMVEVDYIKLASKLCEEENLIQTGYSFIGITIDTICNLLYEKCRNMHLVTEHDMNTEKLLFFSGKSGDDKTSYLLTIAIKEEEDIINVVFIAYSNKKEGLVDFLTEITDCTRYAISSLDTVKEVTTIETHNVLNILDSVLVRSEIEIGGGFDNNSIVNIQDNVKHKSKIT